MRYTGLLFATLIFSLFLPMQIQAKTAASDTYDGTAFSYKSTYARTQEEAENSQRDYPQNTGAGEIEQENPLPETAGGAAFNTPLVMPQSLGMEAATRGSDEKGFSDKNYLSETFGNDPISGISMDLANMNLSMLSGLLNLPIGKLPVKPYIGFGLGVLTVNYNADFYIADDEHSLYKDFDDMQHLVPAWSLGTGAAYKVSDLLTLDLGYRYVATTGKIATELMDSLDSAFEAQFKIKAHDIMLGLRAAF